jgi:endoglucanase
VKTATRVVAFMAAVMLMSTALSAFSVQASNPFRGRKLYVDPGSPARKQADAWARSRPQDAALMRLIAEQPQVIWLGEWLRDARGETDAHVSRITSARALPVFAAYNIPHRDCGSYSAGGSRNADNYRRWIVDLVRGVKSRPTVVILEPDAIASIDCLPARLKDERYVLLQETVKALRQGGVSVYIDAGHANWQSPAEIADRLKKSGIENADGFSLNVSNFQSTETNIAYGEKLSRLVGGKHFVIDTSRNGKGTQSKEWCNVRGQALGHAPTTDTGHPLVDAFLWVKVPGQSDGTCNGGPRAGTWWADYALELSKAADALGSVFPK